MFYSHEILTRREHGVATLWLVATLGSRSSLKRVTRKAILDVDLLKACKTITAPDVPLALRLQGNLLFGASRVFSQQCAYVYSDAQSLSEKLRSTSRRTKDSQLDPSLAYTRSEQHNLITDPGFDIDLDLGFDLSLFQPSGQTSQRSGQWSSQSLLPIKSRLSFEAEKQIQLLLPSIDTPNMSASAQDTSRRSDISLAGLASDYDAVDTLLGGQAVFEDDFFHVADDGELIDMNPFHHISDGITRTGMAALQAADNSALEDAGEPQYQVGEHPVLLQAVDTGQTVNNVDEFEGLQMQMVHLQDDLDATDPTFSQIAFSNPTFPFADLDSMAGALQRRTTKAKLLEFDQEVELSNRDLSDWNRNYARNMIQAQKIKVKKLSLTQARRNAEFLILGQGIGGVISNLGDVIPPHPLAVFSGQTLLRALTGQSPGHKRSLSNSADEDGDVLARRTRARSEEHDHARGNEHGLVLDNEAVTSQYDLPSELEVGRQAPSSLNDHLSQMPWNVSSRQQSLQPYGSSLRRISSSIGMTGGMDLRFSSEIPGWRPRLTSASPLLGKGRKQTPSDLNFTDEDHYIDTGINAELEENFELYGPAAEVNTQQAADSAWVTSVMEREAHNYLTFLRNEIESRAFGASDMSGKNVIAFEELLSSQSNSRVVAAQAFLHTLTLASQGIVDVQQSAGFTHIMISIVQKTETILPGGRMLVEGSSKRSDNT